MNGNDKMVYYIAGRFDLPVHFRDYVYLRRSHSLNASGMQPNIGEETKADATAQCIGSSTIAGVFVRGRA